MNSLFAGKAGIVTGASSGIGREIAMTLGKSGMELWLVGRSIEQLTATAQAIAAEDGGTTHCVTLELEKPGALARLVEEVGIAHPYLFTLINNAGVMYPEKLTETESSHWREMFEINLMTPMESCTAAVKVMRAHAQPAHLINISSLAGKENIYGAYGISKSAIDHLGRTLRYELEQDDIRITTITPGGFASNLSRGFAEETIAKFDKDLAKAGITPDNENFKNLLGDPKHIANMICYILQQPIELNFEEITIRPAIDLKL